MTITVILCTYNRCQLLSKALDSIAASSLPGSVKWEVLVVDNNSKDRTRDVVEEFCRKYPGRFRYLFEPQQGKSYALNAGIRESRGDVLAFTDDDVIVEPTWLKNLTAGLYNHEWAGAGGRILPQWPYSPPSWFPVKEPYGSAPLALFDLGPQAGPLTEPPFGANMAYQKRVFEKYGGFRTDLGRSGDRLLSNADTEFGRRLLAAGERFRYEPSGLIYHLVDSRRIQKQYVLDWWFCKGRADIREFGIPDDARWYVAGIPTYSFRRLALWTLRWMMALGPKQRFCLKAKVWTMAGEIEECYRLSRAGKRKFEFKS